MKTNYKHIRALKNDVLASEEILTFIQNNPREFFEKIEEDRPPIEIPWVFVIVLLIIGTALVLSIIYASQIALADPIKIKGEFQVVKIPEIFGIVASSVIAAIAGLLAPSPIKNKE